MLRSALEGKEPVLFLSPGYCVFCGRQRPMELAVTWMCSRCKRKPLYELFWLIHVPGTPRQERSESA
jgi:hypothetical protein